MAFAGDLGMVIDVARIPAPAPLSDIALLFSETPSRFLVEVPPVAKKSFETILKGYAACVGRVTKTKTLIINDSRSRRTLVQEPLPILSRAWEGQI
jgi:phosphoribosylformylglycinamidine synthase